VGGRLNFRHVLPETMLSRTLHWLSQERRKIWLIAIILLLAILGVLIIRGRTKTGPPLSSCPGPDAFGYTCDDGADYYDATQDTMLYADDGLIELELPFPFSFYGNTYDRVKASSNGNLQFNTNNSAYDNGCLADGPLAGMGEMISPYWDDLDLSSYGYLETEIVGEAPERIFVIEWDDIPSSGSSEERITFEVQLFEDSNDIKFLYLDVTRLDGNNGSSATIGLQSESLGYVLEHSCNSFSISDGDTILFPYPGSSRSSVVGPASNPEAQTAVESEPQAKGDVADLLSTLNNRGPDGLKAYRFALLSQYPASDGQWMWSDVTGDSQEELVFLWAEPIQSSERSHLAIIDRDSRRGYHLLWDVWPLARQTKSGVLVLVDTPDLNGDGSGEIIIKSSSGDYFIVVADAVSGFNMQSVPGRCAGEFFLSDVDSDGVLEMVRENCGRHSRLITDWDTDTFKTK